MPDEHAELQLKLRRAAEQAFLAKGDAEGQPRPKLVSGRDPHPIAGPKLRSVEAVPFPRQYSSQPISWVVENFIAEGTVTGISGEPGSGKSSLVTSLGYAVSCGVPFAGLSTVQRRVLILDRENPLSLTVEKLDRLGVQENGQMTFWGGWCEEEPPEPSSPIVMEYVRSCSPPPLIIVDSFVAFLKGSENDAAEVRQYMNGFRALANLGATVVFLHHPGKGESSREFRGSSDIKASIDVGYLLANLGDLARLSMLRLKAFKSRFAATTELILKYRDGSFSAGTESRATTVYDSLVELLKQNPGIKVTEFEALAVKKGLGRNSARDFADRGEKSGRIAVSKGPKSTRYYTWKDDENEASEDLF